jgi:hypothetical protein
MREEGVFTPWCRQVNTKRHDGSRYAFWPFWTSAVYGGEAQSGVFVLSLPVYGEVNPQQRDQRLVLPHFFSYARTDSSERWRLPWLRSNT